MSAISGNVHSRTSQLCKNLDAVLHDKDALAYFISFLQALGADNLVRFWLDVEAFRLAAERTPSIEATNDVATPTKAIRLADTGTPAAKLAAETPPPARCKPVENTGLPDDRLYVSKIPEMPQQRVPTNYCGHASSSASNSPKAIGRLPAHGEVVVSTDSAVPSSSAIPSGLSRPPVDCCPASNPSISDSSQSGAVQQAGAELVSAAADDADVVTISSVSTEDISEPSHKGFIFIISVLAVI